MNRDEEIFLFHEIHVLDKTIGRWVEMVLDCKQEDHKPNLMQGRIIGFLARNRDRDIFQKDIEEEFCIARSTVTGLLKQMEKDGMVQRKSVDKDARLKKVTLTDTFYKNMEEKFRKMHDIIDERLCRGLSEEELRDFCRIVDIMRKNVSADPTKEDIDL